MGEAAAAWHSGHDGVTNAWTSSFWWSDALGALAAHNVSVSVRGGSLRVSPHVYNDAADADALLAALADAAR